MQHQKVRHIHLYAIALSAMLVMGFVSPAQAHNGGRRAFGEVASFDGTMLEVSMGNGGSLVAPVADDVKIKVDHRSNKAHAKHSKSPSRGSLDDLVPGAKIWRIRIVCQEVVSLRITRSSTPATAATAIRVFGDEAEPGDDSTDDNGDEASNPCSDQGDDQADEPGDDTGDEVAPPAGGGGTVGETPDDDGSDDGADGGGLLPGLPGL